jgi:cellulose synthase (UDP-forming)
MKTIYKSKQFNKLSPLVTSVILASIFSAFYYLYFIIFQTRPSDFVLYSLILLTEFYVVATAVFTWWTIMFHDQEPLTSVLKVKNSLLKEYINTPIAVIITVYTEDLEIVEKAILSAKLMNFNPTVYVGDDSSRKEIAAMAKKYGAIYVSRDNRRHFKSGNLSNILKNIDVDFVAVFDVDHIPHPDFLTETLPYFSDANVAFVQTPQYYTNTNNVISKCAAGSQNIFYELIMPGKNSFNSAFCVGTNVIFRKAALDKTFEHKFHLAEHSEDILVSLKLHEAGWKSVYIPKVLARGLAPDDVIRYFKQQERWARGGFEIFLKSNPFFMSGLNPEQKLQYFFSSIHYFSGFVILFYLIIPILYLLFGIRPLNTTDDTQWMIHFFPFFISKFLLILYLMGRFDISLMSGSFALFPVYIKAFFKEVFRKDYNWIATNTAKNKNSTESVFDYLHWHIFFILLSIIAICVGFLTFKDKTDFIFASFWTLLNASILGHFVYSGIKESLQHKDLTEQLQIEVKEDDDLSVFSNYLTANEK